MGNLPNSLLSLGVFPREAQVKLARLAVGVLAQLVAGGEDEDLIRIPLEGGLERALAELPAKLLLKEAGPPGDEAIAIARLHGGDPNFGVSVGANHRGDKRAKRSTPSHPGPQA